MTYVLIGFAMVLLLVALGEVVGTKTPFLKNIHLPGAVIGGLIGLSIGPEGYDVTAYFTTETNTQKVYNDIVSFPALFINIVFACLMLAKPIDRLSRVFKRARPHVVMGHIIAWGQYVVGICITLFILLPFLSVDPLVAPSIAIGFQGGHGTAAGLTQNYEAFNFADGKTIAYSIATIGVILATVFSPILARVLIKHKAVDFNKEQSDDKKRVEKETKSFSSLTGTLTMHFALIALTILVAKLFLDFSSSLEEGLRPQADEFFIQFIPLFSVVLVSGLFVQLLLQKLNFARYFNRSLFNKISAFGLDIVIVSALTTLSLEAVKEYWVTISLLALGGFLWNLAVFFLLGPRLFPKPWIPYALSDLGGGTGTTASGLMLIRVADPKKLTNAQQTYSEKQPFYEPIMGGGLVTAIALPMIAKVGLTNTLFITGAILFAWFIYAVFIIREE